MSSLILSVLQSPAPMAHRTRQIPSGMFGVGRASPSDWVLDDQTRQLSKRHCVFHQDERGWSVTDVSRNGSYLLRNGTQVRLGDAPHLLSAGERLRLGEYVLAVELGVDLEEDERFFLAPPLGSRPPGPGARPMRVSPPPKVPPSEIPARQLPAAGAEPDREPTRIFLDDAAASVRAAAAEGARAAPRASPPEPAPAGAGAAGAAGAARPGRGLSALLEGALLAQGDVLAPGAEADVLRSAGSALRTTVAEIRRLRAAMLGEPHEARVGNLGVEARPLAEARTERDALRWLLSDDRRYDCPPNVVIEAAFAEFRQHHDLLVRAARRSIRAVFESLDPDEPERHLLPQWLDVLPGWRRARGAVLARRRYRRLRGNLDEIVDQALARAYRDVHREAEARWKPR